MIFNTELTLELIELFGAEVLGWSYSKIRSELEDAVNKALYNIDNTSSKPIKAHMFAIYADLKDLDNRFTEYYTNSLDSVKEI